MSLMSLGPSECEAPRKAALNIDERLMGEMEMAAS